ncbi:MAG: radical SAM protein [Deltaproteobacteria bacterium]|nr:radical SAM protein [Deltaproteobacteria bacterium]
MRPAERVHRPGAGANPLRPGRELLLSFAFRCNFACTFCYVEDGLAGRYRGVSLEEARQLLTDPRVTEGVTRIVLSGGEVTLDRELPAFIALARAVPSVEHVRIQTNASRLAEDGLAARLVALGVDELFVSLHAADAARCDAITQRPGSFSAILAGLDAARAAGATIITNTVVCATNVHALADILGLAHDRGAAAAELWGYVPRVDALDARRLLVRVTEAAPHVHAALAAAEARGLPVTVKYFPRCLLGRFAHLQSDAQPRLVIDDAFWQSYPQYGCLYEGVCAAAVADGCTGLSDAYVRRFGWEEDALVPFAREVRTPDAPTIAAYHSWAHAPEVRAPAPLDAHDGARLLALVGLAEGDLIGGATALAPERIAGGLRLRFAISGERLAIDLRPRDDARACFARTASLDISHPPWPETTTIAARPLLAALAARLRERDDGGLARMLAGGATISEAPRPSAIDWTAPPPPARGFAAAIEAALASGQLDPRVVEPSVALGAPDEWRVLVNPSPLRRPAPPDDARALTRALLAPLAIPAGLAALADAWLAADRVLYVGAAATASGLRTKLYLQTASDAHRASAAHALGIALPAPEVALVAIDLVDGELVAFKRYARITPIQARAESAGPLLALLEARGLLLGELPLLLATRHDADDRLIDRALHVDVRAFPQLALGPAWAHACGDEAAATAIAASGRATRVISETLGTTRGRHVYLGDRTRSRRRSPRSSRGPMRWPPAIPPRAPGSPPRSATSTSRPAPSRSAPTTPTRPRAPSARCSRPSMARWRGRSAPPSTTAITCTRSPTAIPRCASRRSIATRSAPSRRTPTRTVTPSISAIARSTPGATRSTRHW